jgi:hypothetical protein
MRSVSVKYHIVTLSTVTSADPFPRDDLQLLYRTAGIDLDLVEGAGLDRDPLGSQGFSYRRLLDHYRAKDREFGHLIVGLATPRPDVAGELLDLETRGLVVVYRNSTYIQEHGRSALLQTCAHELGHMLNLDHNHVSSSFDSIMRSAGDRKQNIAECWEAAKAEAADARAQGKPVYFDPPAREVPCYPFALVARNRLNTESDESFLPWGTGKFEGGAHAVNDALGQHTIKTH